jgi:hypothetical protein
MNFIDFKHILSTSCPAMVDTPITSCSPRWNLVFGNTCLQILNIARLIEDCCKYFPISLVHQQRCNTIIRTYLTSWMASTFCVIALHTMNRFVFYATSLRLALYTYWTHTKQYISCSYGWELTVTHFCMDLTMFRMSAKRSPIYSHFLYQMLLYHSHQYRHTYSKHFANPIKNAKFVDDKTWLTSRWSGDGWSVLYPDYTLCHKDYNEIKDEERPESFGVGNDFLLGVLPEESICGA